MKYLNLFILMSVVIFFGCEKYDDYTTDFDYSIVYFALQNPVRVVISNDSDMSIEVGVALGGKRKNTVKEVVNFKVEPSLLTNHALFTDGVLPPFTLLPSDYYTLSNDNQMVIEPGSFIGSVKVSLDPQKFVADTNAICNYYALPLLITESTTDSILSWKIDPVTGDTLSKPKDYTIVVIRYQNPYHGIYYHKGLDIAYDGENAVDTATYSNPELVKNEKWNVFTSAGDKVKAYGLGRHITSGENYMELKINGSSVSLEAAQFDGFSNISIDEGSYDKANRSFYLNYHYRADVSGYVHHVFDTLIFRNDEIGFETW